MFGIGYLFIKNYIVWISPAPIGMDVLSPMAERCKYFDVLVTKRDMLKDGEKIYQYKTYVDLLKSGYLKLDSRNYPTSLTDSVEYEAFLARKNITIPLAKMSHSSVQTMLNNLMEHRDIAGRPIG